MENNKSGIRSFLKIHPNDNVLVALKDITRNTAIVDNGHSFLLKENVAAKLKFFINDLATGEAVIMYGVMVGKVQNNILQGQVMTITNTKHAAGEYGLLRCAL